MHDEAPSAWELAGIVLAAFCAVLLSLVLFRVHAFVLAAPYAYLTLGVAAMGGVVGAMAVAARDGWTDPAAAPRWRLAAAAVFPAAIVVALVAVLFLPAAPGGNARGWLAWAVVAVAGALPYFALGAVTVSALAVRRAHLPVLTAGACAGAAFGVAVYGPLLSAVDGPSAVLGVGVAGSAMAACWARAADRRAAAVVCAVLAVLWVAITGVNAASPVLRVRWIRGEKAEQFEKELWGPGGVVRARYVGGAQGESVEIVTDVGRREEILPFSGSLEPLAFLDRELPQVAYRLKPGAEVCIVNAGRGRDVLAALRAGARRIVAIEPDPLVARMVAEEFREFGGSWVEQPAVEWVVEDPRSWLRRSGESFDLILVAFPLAAAAADWEASSMRSDWNFTVESCRLMLRRLREGGVLVVTADVTAPFMEAESRLDRLLTAASPRLTALCRWPFSRGNREVWFLRPAGWTEAELQTVGEWLPAGVPEWGDFPVMPGLSPQRGRAAADDRPYPYNLTWGKDLLVGRGDSSVSAADHRGQRNLLRGAVLAAFGTAVLLVLLVFHGRIQPVTSTACLYVFSGIATVAFAGATLHRAAPLLGGWSTSWPLLAVVALVGAGVGALVAQRWPAGPRLVAVGLAAIGGVAALSAVCSSGVSSWFDGTGTGARWVVAATLGVVPATLVGIVLPPGWRRAASDARSLACGIGLASGTGIATAMAALLLFVHVGYSAGLWVAAAAYGAASLASFVSARS